MIELIVGQEVEVPTYGVGRVMSRPINSRIPVKTYADGITRNFAPENVKPWSAQATWYCGCGHTNGVNLARCAACNRDPRGKRPGE